MSKKTGNSNKGAKKENNNHDLSVEDRYKSMTDHEHILKLPDTYIGGITEDESSM